MTCFNDTQRSGKGCTDENVYPENTGMPRYPSSNGRRHMTRPTEHTAARPELNAYEAALPRLLPQHEGEYVVIKEERVLRFFPRYDEALQWGYETFGLDSFFVKRVIQDEQNTVHFTRDVGP